MRVRQHEHQGRFGLNEIKSSSAHRALYFWFEMLTSQGFFLCVCVGCFLCVCEDGGRE